MQQYAIDIYDHTFSLIQTVAPENLHLVLNDGDTSTIDFELSVTGKDLDDNPIIQGYDYIGPYRHIWVLRYGPSIVIDSGLISQINLALGRPYIKVSGVNWLGYLNRRFPPFDGRPGHANDFVNTALDFPMQGYWIWANNEDIGDILTGLIAYMGVSGSVPVAYLTGTLGLNVLHYGAPLADTTTFLSTIQELSNYDTGFAFEATLNLGANQVQITAALSRWYGDPDAIAGDPLHADLIYTFNASTPPQGLDFTNSGPECTHIMGTGAGSTTQQVVTKGNAANQDEFYRLDAAFNFPNAYTLTDLESYTDRRFAEALNPIHQIPLVVDPFAVDQSISDGYFWTNFKPGRAIWIDLDLFGFHHIDSAHHIVSMDCQFDNQGNCLVSIQQNQIYDTSGQAFVEEG